MNRRKVPSARELQDRRHGPTAFGGDVKTICSRCKQTITETFEKGGEKKVSHGICPACLAILESRIREGVKTTNLGAKPDTVPVHSEDA